MKTIRGSEKSVIKVKVGLRPIATKINLPTVLKTTILPGDSMERLFMAGIRFIDQKRSNSELENKCC